MKWLFLYKSFAKILNQEYIIPFLRITFLKGKTLLLCFIFSSENDKYSLLSKLNDKPELKNEGCCC